ncbi:MAG: adenine deaminase [Balneolales bacterium]|nr:adenine deaminase [Balneolales bacterium]
MHKSERDTSRTLRGIIADVKNRTLFPGEIRIEDGKIAEVKRLKEQDVPQRFILPGFVDAHIHIESSMLVPSAFARIAVQHGTVATVSDPHEIANVCGIEGVNFMITDGNKVPLKFCFGAPSCVPATAFETAGATLGVAEVEELLTRDDIYYLAEMMNWPGVLHSDPEVLAKIASANCLEKPVDGHAPGLKGDMAKTYASAGISTDHECFTLDEALDKIKAGMKIIIREGSAARNYEALKSLLLSHPSSLMFCSDDKHPDDLLKGHINKLVSKAIADGFELFDALYAACVAPVEHYNLPVGLLQPGDPADFVITENLETFDISETWIDGEAVFSNGNTQFEAPEADVINNFTSYSVNPEDFILRSDKAQQPVIVALDGELITQKEYITLPKKDDVVLPDLEKDVLKMAVLNRYEIAEPAVAFIRNFGIRDGAIASSVGHDCHNIIAVGSSDEYLSRVVNLIMAKKGGMAAVHGESEKILPLPVAGIMTNARPEVVAKGYEELTEMARNMGSGMKAPFMLISFMALLVIPALKLSDKGLFDGEKFCFVDQ